MRLPVLILVCCYTFDIQGSIIHDNKFEKNTADIRREDLSRFKSRIFQHKSGDVSILNPPIVVNDDNARTTKNTDDVTTVETIIVDPRNNDIAILNQETTEATNNGNTDDDIEESFSSTHGQPESTTQPPVIIEPRNLDNTEKLKHINMHEIDFEMAKDLKLVRQIEEGRQQNFRQVVCNDKTASLEGTSVNNFYVVQSPYYPQNYPTFLWCDYKFSVPVNRQVIVKVLAMDVHCPFDFVEMGREGENALVTLCPLNSVRTTYVMLPEAAAYTFRITFKSDWIYTLSGFQMLVYLNTTTPTTTVPPTVSTVSTTLPPISDCSCGKYSSNRIVGGFEAAPNAFPHQIGLMRNTSTQPFCGGTLISPNFVLTAAHCTVSFLAVNGLRVSIGDVNYRVKDEGEQFIPVLKIIPHPNYNSTTQNFDYSLLQLATPVNASKYAGFACLPPDVSQTFEGTNMTISGWGTISAGGAQSPPLKAAFVTGLSNEACRATPYKNMITSNMICAAAPGTDACQGDSGGPMVANVNGRVTLVGVTSFGVGCANATYPGVYSRVSAQKDWIIANTDAGRCQN